MFVKKYTIFAVIFSLFYNSCFLIAMKKETISGGIIVTGMYYINKKFNDTSFKHKTINNYSKELFKQGDKQITEIDDVIKKEIHKNVIGSYYVMPEDKILTPELIDYVLTPANIDYAQTEIKKAATSLIESQKDALYDVAGKAIGGGAIIIGTIGGLRKKSPFTLKSMSKTVLYGSTAGIATTCAATHCIETYPKEITHYGLSLYDKYGQQIALKEVEGITNNVIQYLKTELKENGSWEDRWIIHHAIRTNPLTPTLLIGVEKLIAQAIIPEYNKIKKAKKNDIVHHGKNVIGTLSSLALVVNLINPDPTPTKFAFNHFLLAVSLGCTSNTSSNKEIKN